MKIWKVLSAIGKFIRICICGSDTFFEEEIFEDGRLRFRSEYPSINGLKFLSMFIIAISILASLGGSDSFLEKSILVLTGIGGSIIMLLLTAIGGYYDWIILDENGITEIKLWDDVMHNGRKTVYKWEDLTSLSALGGGRSPANMLAEYKGGKIAFAVTNEIYNYAIQYYPNIYKNSALKYIEKRE